MGQIKLTDLKTVNLSEVLYELQRLECEQFGIPIFPKGVDPILPDGKAGIWNRVRELVVSRGWGNQCFNNDSLYIFAFSTFNGEKMSADEAALYDLCVSLGAVEEERVIFNTTW